jgi:hypothetical protein
MHLLDFSIFAITFAVGCAVFLGLEHLENRRFERHAKQALDLTKEN